MATEPCVLIMNLVYLIWLYNQFPLQNINISDAWLNKKLGYFWGELITVDSLWLERLVTVS